MPSFGEKLKLEREKRKISLDQISSTTKIGTRMLQALEEEKFSQLPGGIFNKGFVRAYARVVGLDEDQTVADYLQASGEASPARPELVRNAGPRDSSQRDSSPRDTIRIRETVRDKTTRDTAARDKANRDTAAREEEHRISRLEAISDDQSPALPWGVFAVILLIIAAASRSGNPSIPPRPRPPFPLTHRRGRRPPPSARRPTLPPGPWLAPLPAR